MLLLAIYFHAALAQRAHVAPSQRASMAEAASVRRFVQGFYDWYTPLALQEGVDSELLALRIKGYALSPELRGALWKDWTAQSKVKGYIVGIDFDPFLASQDPNYRYVVGKIASKGKTWLVGVHGVPTKRFTNVSKLTAQVQKGARGWVFTNFIYDRDNLLSILAGLKQDRERTGQAEIWAPTRTWFDTNRHTYQRPPGGYAADENTAIAMGTAAIAHIYGEDWVKDTGPYRAKLFDDIWVVYCTFEVRSASEGLRVGGPTWAEVDKTTGAVLDIVSERQWLRASRTQ